MFTKPKWFISFLIAMILLNDISFVSASPPAKIVAGVVTNVVSTIFKWLWSLRTPVINTEKGTTSRSLMKFEAGYRVETVFDGSKVGIEPYSVEMSPTGELLILDSSNNNLYKISTPFSRSYSRPKLVAGSAEGYTGHVDGKLREARMYSPKAFTLDDSGNIYIADTMNMAIRKITDTGITTIAGGKWSHGGAHHMDGSNEDAKFSDDFDVTYVRSRCSLLVTDRGNQAIREIQLNDVDCSYEQPQVQDEQHEENLFLGGAVLVAAAFSGYMLALLKQRVQSLFSTKRDPRMKMNNNHAITPAYQRHPIVVKPTLMPPQDEYEEEDEGLFFSFGRLIINATSSVAEVLVGLLFLGFRKKKPRHHDLRHFQQLNRNSNHAWPMHNGYVIREEDELPGLEMRTPIVRKPYPEPQVIQSQACFEGRDAEFQQHPAKIKPQEVVQKEQQQQQQQQQQQSQQKQKQKQRNVESCKAKTSSEKGSEKSEIVFGAVQEQDGRREAMVIKAVDYSDPVYNQHNIRPRVNYMGYSAYSYS